MLARRFTPNMSDDAMEYVSIGPQMISEIQLHSYFQYLAMSTSLGFNLSMLLVIDGYPQLFFTTTTSLRSETR